MIKKFKILGLALLSTIVVSNFALADVNWKVSPSRTTVKFKVKHFVLMEVEGRFKNPEGLVTTANEEDFSHAYVEARVPVGTISTGNTDRDTHLRQEVFFNSEKFPEMVFKSKNIVAKGSDEFAMEGNLTIRGVTKPVSFIVTFTGLKQSGDGKVRSKFVAKGAVNRYDFGLKWNELTEAGGMVVGDTVDIEMDVTLEKENAAFASASTNSHN
ncbi:MAG: YceI family protein [Proteobacteria bacterium]|nr:YceI family protein [Pseudomonadota bacterium]